MSNFNYYSAYYDLLYKEKNYLAEADYITALIKKHAPDAESLIDFGCGTGSHDIFLAEKGYKVTGVDLSQTMIDKANQKLQEYPHLNIDFRQGDFRKVRLDKKFDIAVSLFHVMSYQTTNDDLEKAFLTAKEHLKPGGIFIFDFWYGPGVLTDKPTVRVKRLEDDHIEVLRITEPIIYPNENKVDVCFEVQIKNKIDNKIEVINEIHPMRYLFLPEIVCMIRNLSFEFIESKEWMKDSTLQLTSWNGLVICRNT